MDKNNWDLESLLKGKSFEHLYKEWLDMQNKIKTLYKTWLSNLSNFKRFLFLLNDDYEVIDNRLSTYILNKKNEDVLDQKWISISQKKMIDSNEFSTHFSDFTNQILKNENKIRKFLLNKDVTIFKRFFELYFRKKDHKLSDEQEKLISKIAILNSGYYPIYEKITSGMKFDDALNKNNKKIKINTQADIVKILKSSDRTLRKNAWISFHNSYNKHQITLTQTLYYTYLTFNTFAKIYNYKNYIDSVMFEDEVNLNIVLNLYSAFINFKTLYMQYKKTLFYCLKKQLKISKIEPWDTEVDLVKKPIFFTIDEAKNISLEALNFFGEEYIDVVKTMFSENWISWMPKKNKQTGAYSIGDKGIEKYYILLNYDNTLDSLSTLVHEIGHSVQAHFTIKNQKVYTDTNIFYAEISSITNEILLQYHLLKKFNNDKQMQKNIYNNLISNFFNTTSRQLIFSNFEFNVNQWIEKNESFVPQKIKNEYADLVRQYLGNSHIKYNSYPYNLSLSTILRIDHFYMGNFYVYKYAIGQIVALLIADKLINGDIEFKNKYFQFLSSGDSLSPIETIKILDIDITKKDIYGSILAILQKWIQEFKKLSK